MKAYEEQLYKEINEDRENHGRKTLNNESKRNEEQREVTASTTDPDMVFS